ncbi:AsnC family protein [Crossiella sp. NPDC003009]
MVSPDPVDMRLLALLAESGRAAPVHEIAARAGVDPREAASRLVALSASGLPLIVGVEFDPNGLRGALAAAGAWAGFPPAAPPPPPPSYGPPVYGPGPAHGTPSGVYPAHGTPSGPYGTPSGPHGTPSGPYGTPSGPYPAHQPGGPTGAYPPPPPVYNPPTGPPSGGFPAQPPFPATGADPMSTWGPPQSAAWARGDQPTVTTAPAAGSRTGVVGGSLETEGQEGERLVIQLVEVVDPADFLFTAAGYRLQEGERSVVVHTELHNRGPVPFASLPDLYLMLVTEDGQQISKAPVALSSRPPHRIGVAPGETAGGHTVYVLPESLRLTHIRWSPHPGDDKHSLTWAIED